MKRLLPYLIPCCAFMACTDAKEVYGTEPRSIAVSGLFDITDSLGYRPTADQLLGQFHCELYPKASLSFRMSAISNRVQNEYMKFSLAGTEPTGFSLGFTEDQERSKAILRFYAAVRKGVNDFYSQCDTSKPLDRSVCGRTILNELKFLAEQKCDQATLVIASDLRENDDFNTYAMDSIKPQEIEAWLDSIEPNLPVLNGITALFVFTSRNQEEDKAFGAIVQGYKLFLEGKGAIVKIQANL